MLIFKNIDNWPTKLQNLVHNFRNGQIEKSNSKKSILFRVG